MNKFPKLHLWMMLPLFIALAGFFFSYWSRFNQVPFHQHVHGLTATLWYLFMVIQPWLIQRNNPSLHRKMGFIGLFLAGAVVFSALQVIPHNLTNERILPVLRYGLSWADFLFLIGFSYSVIMAMMNSKQLEIHARYMIASVFWAIMPALGRLLYFPLLIKYGYPTPYSFIEVLYFSSFVILLSIVVVMVLDYRKEKKIYTSYILAAIGIIIFAAGFETIGEAEWWISFCDNVLRSSI